MKDTRWTQLRLMQRIKHLDFICSLSSKTIVTKMKISSEYGWIVILIFFSMDEFSVWCEQYLLDVLLYMFMQVFIWQMFSAVFSVVHCFIVYCQSALRQFVNAFWFLLGIVIHIIKLTMDKRSSSKKLKNLAKLDKFTIYRSDALINVYIITKQGYRQTFPRDIKTWLR